MSVRRSQGRRRGGEFRSLSEAAVGAGSLLLRRDQGRHLQAMAAWREAVGERLQRITRVAQVDDDVLTVEVPDEAWGDTLRRLRSPILERVRLRLGERSPRHIEFRIAPGFWRPARRPAPSVVRGAAAAPEAAVAAPARAAAPAARLLADEDVPVADPALRRRLLYIGDRYLGRPRR
jgi:hypothetical protein